MTRIWWRTGLCLAILLAAAATKAWAQRQQQPPQVGYVLPAGGQQGRTFEVTIGGQYLKDTAEIYVSGQGVQAEWLDHTAPLPQNKVAEIREIFNEARKKIQDEAKKNKERPRPVAIRELFTRMAEQQGITEKQLEGFRRRRQQRSDPKYQLNPQLSEWVTVRITVGTDAEPGTRELRLATKFGLSNPLRFRIGGLPEYHESEPNDKLSDATAVASLPAVLNGHVMPGDVDRFRLRARQGQRLVVRVAARDLIPYLADAVPGWFQANAALYDAEGREVAYANDYRFDPDPVLLYEVPRDGDYVLEIRDSIYRGREDFVYRVTVGELPFVSGIFPLGARAGKQTTITVEGWNLPPDGRKVDLTPEATGVQPFSVTAATGVSNAVSLKVDDLPERCEKERNDEASAAEKLTLPLVVNGRIDRPGDWDVFGFDARQGDRIIAEVHARRLNSPLDSMLKLTDTRGRAVAVNDDHEDKGQGLVTHHADSLLTVSIPKSGYYLLWLGDTQGKGGPQYAYRLRVSHGRPDFELRIVPSAINALGGDTVPVTVYALRRDGFSGDIRLRLKDAPKGFTLDGGWVPGGQEMVRTTLTVPGKPEQKLSRLRLEGYATAGGEELCREAVPADDMMQAFIYHHLVPAESWAVVVEPIRWNRPPWTIDGDSPVKLTAGKTTTLRMRTRRSIPKEQLRLELNDPPKGIGIQKVTPVAGGIDIVLSADSAEVESGLKGNLIFNVFREWKPPKRDGQPQPKMRRIPQGAMPAVPFEIAGG